MKVLLIGSGGREHALFWKLSQSSKLTLLHAAPGNGGFPESSIVVPPSMEVSSLAMFIKKQNYDLVVVGPEEPLVHGLADELSGDVPIFGPLRSAAMLEGSKEFSKNFMFKYNIPTARAVSFTSVADAFEYLNTHEIPVVVKADGLAAGKGVTVAHSLQEAKQAVQEALEKNRFGDSGKRILVEEFMQGEEASVFALCDGEKAIAFQAAQDHKRAYDDDKGPNTGGMGAYSPVPLLTSEIMNQVQHDVLDKVMSGMKAEGSPYRGLLYAGLMIHNHKVKVVEFNVRFGDPETQPLLTLLDEDLLDLCYASAAGSLPNRKLNFKKGTALTVVVAAEGYPGSYQKNIPLNIPPAPDDVYIFHAGTKRQDGNLVSSGGRVLGVTAVGKEPGDARDKVYSYLNSIKSNHLFYRKDIGLRAVSYS